MSGRVFSEAGCGRKVRFGLAIAALLLVGLSSGPAVAQGTQDIAGTWQGMMNVGQAIRIIVKVSRAGDAGAANGGWKAVLYSIDTSGGEGREASSAALDGQTFRFAIASVDGRYEGRLSADGGSMMGTWTQSGQSLPFNLVRANEATAWEIPEPVKKMAADADPAFEVATIKPSDPSKHSTGFHYGQGRRVWCESKTVNEVISIVYGVSAKQIVGAPAWFDTDRYDIDGIPDVAGVANYNQMLVMYRKLLAERFKLTFHREKRELAVYAITVGKTGEKLTKSANQEGMSDTSLTELNSQRAVFRVSSTTMKEFADAMQMSILDKPVVDQTGLEGKFDFLLKWTPDETQFIAMGVRFSPPGDNPNALPGLFAAMQEQLGLKLEAVKAQADVLVVDKVERPSAN
jgi:uncharacterized protein (TIGR03435 family)